MSLLRRRRGLLPVLTIVGVVVVLLVVALSVLRTSREPRSEAVDQEGSRAGWKTIAYDGVCVDVPASWTRIRPDGCQFRFERWGPPDAHGCAFGEGVAFYASATFDAGRGPGVGPRDGPGLATWDGYVHAGEYAVYAASTDRARVRAVLAGARAAG